MNFQMNVLLDAQKQCPFFFAFKVFFRLFFFSQTEELQLRLPATVMLKLHFSQWLFVRPSPMSAPLFSSFPSTIRAQQYPSVTVPLSRFINQE